MSFKDRQDAGKQLAKKLLKYSNQKNTLVIGLPRGGVVIAYQISQELNLPLDIVVPRKISAPFDPEFAIGAISEDGQGIFNDQIIRADKISQKYIDKEIAKEKKEAERRSNVYRQDRPPVNFKDQTIILVDDGIATGSTMEVSINYLRKNGVKKIILAVPVLPASEIGHFKKIVEELIYIEAPNLFFAIGAFYSSFNQTSDQEVVKLMSD